MQHEARVAAMTYQRVMIIIVRFFASGSRQLRRFQVVFRLGADQVDGPH